MQDFCLTKFAVGRDGKTAYKRLKGKSAEVQVLSFANGMLWKRRRAAGPLGKLTCMRDDGVYLGIKATTGEVFVVNWNGVWLARTFRRKTATERWERTNLEIIVAVLWRMNEDDAQIDGERLKGEVGMMDKGYKEKQK